jgi:hypothetical protein
LPSLGLRRALLPRGSLTSGLIPLTLAALGLTLLALLLSLTLLTVLLLVSLALRTLIFLRRLAGGLILIALGLALLALIWCTLLRLAAAVLRGLRLLTILSRAAAGRALALGGTTGLAAARLATAWHVLGGRQRDSGHQRSRAD